MAINLPLLFLSSFENQEAARGGRVVSEQEEEDSHTQPGVLLSRLVTRRTAGYNLPDFGKAENRFLRGDLEGEESPNTIGRDAA